MSTVFMLLALVPSLHGSLSSPRWLDDYSTGYQQAAAAGKPLVVVVGRGPQGWNALDYKGSLDSKTQQLLRERFVCVYVDAGQEANKQLLGQLKVGDGTGLVVSDRSGQFVAFRHAGSMNGVQLAETLHYHSTVMVQPSSTYAAPNTPVAPAMNYSVPMSRGYCRG